MFLSAGFAFPAQLEPLAERIPREAVVGTALFLMALSLDASSIFNAVRRPKAVILAVGINFLLLPLAAWAVALSLPTVDLAVGLLIVAAAPSTLASAAVWTRRAGGNDAVALMGTIVTNLACFLVTPFWLLLTTRSLVEAAGAAGSGFAAVELDTVDLIRRLAALVVLPTLAGQLLRLYGPIGTLATRAKTPLGVLAQCGILMIVLTGAVGGGLRLSQGEVGMGLAAWVAMLTSVIGVHVVMLAVGHFVGRAIGVSRGDRIAVGFSGSQKTLMIGLYVATNPPYFPLLPLAMMPMIFYHVCQLLIDTVVADRLRRNVTNSK